MFCIPSTLMPASRTSTRTLASTPTLSRWRTTSRARAGVLRATFTQLATSPLRTKAVTMRTVSRAMASCAWAVEAPMWWVP